jgi:hypothetical protein
MFKNLKNVILGDCEIIKFDNEKFIYPIFKNGRSSLTLFAEKNRLEILKNKEISKLKNIIIFLRNPEERFVSGIWTFFYFTNNQLIDETVLKKIENLETIDKHFIPQYIWLFQLFKYFKGVVHLRPVTELYNLIPNRDGPWYQNPTPWKKITNKEKKKILSIKHEKYTNVDKKILKKYLKQSVELEKIIKEFKI